MSKPILCLDFDGVCHSYVSGWQGPGVIPDGPVPGLFEFLLEAQLYFVVHIYSSRSHQEGGIGGMRMWFERQFSEWAGSTPTPSLRLTFPEHKPPAMVTIDDRGILFMGVWPDVEYLRNFQPWNKGGT